MNKILIALNAILLAAVIFLFVKVYTPASEVQAEEQKTEEPASADKKQPQREQAAGNTPTGKIAYVNIDRLNEESLEILDLVAETKRRKTGIEASVERLSQQYQKKVEEFQVSQKAGIATENDLRAKAREIEDIEREAQNKQMQMDNLSMEITDKNTQFQNRVKDFLSRWNAGRYDFILSYSDAVPSMLLGNSTLEITTEVIDLLNKEYKQSKGKK